VKVEDNRNPVEEIITNVIPVNKSDLCLYLTLRKPNSRETPIPVKEEIVLSCPITPSDLLKVFAISINNNPETMLGNWRVKMLEAKDNNSIFVETFSEWVLTSTHPLIP